MDYWITKFNTQNIDENEKSTVLNQMKNTAEAAFDLGFKEINYNSFENLGNNVDRRSELIEGLTLPIKEHDVIIVQLPLWTQLNFQNEWIQAMKQIKFVKLVAVVHEFIPWTSQEKYNVETDFFFNQLRQFDLIITQNDQMSKRLQKDGLTVPMISQVMWDFRYNGAVQDKKFSKNLYHIADKPVKEVKYQGSSQLVIIGSKANDFHSNDDNIQFQELRKLQNVPAMFEGGFGLVDGDEIVEYEGQTAKDYAQFISPLSLSQFLVSGLPVIVNSNSPHTPLVKSRGIGLVVENPNQINQVLDRITEKEYEEMLLAVKPWQEAISSGLMARRSIMNAIRAVGLGYKDNLYSNAGGEGK